ncbi:hypothetical protein EV126DRAFT_429092 [Verticillium dahliae]|nr:hypothetical protein EV126DRAFT_429092 [Verticillium dahliae]
MMTSAVKLYALDTTKSVTLLSAFSNSLPPISLCCAVYYGSKDNLKAWVFLSNALFFLGGGPFTCTAFRYALISGLVESTVPPSSTPRMYALAFQFDSGVQTLSRFLTSYLSLYIVRFFGIRIPLLISAMMTALGCVALWHLPSDKSTWRENSPSGNLHDTFQTIKTRLPNLKAGFILVVTFCLCPLSIGGGNFAFGFMSYRLSLHDDHDRHTREAKVVGSLGTTIVSLTSIAWFMYQGKQGANSLLYNLGLTIMNVCLGIAGAALFIGTSSFRSLTAGYALIEIGRQSLTLMKSVLAAWLVPVDQEEDEGPQGGDTRPLLEPRDYFPNYGANGNTARPQIAVEQDSEPSSSPSLHSNIASHEAEEEQIVIPQRNTVREQKRLVGFGIDVLLEAVPKLGIGPAMHSLLQLQKQGSWCWPYVFVAASSTLALVFLLAATWFSWLEVDASDSSPGNDYSDSSEATDLQEGEI